MSILGFLVLSVLSKLYIILEALFVINSICSENLRLGENKIPRSLTTSFLVSMVIPSIEYSFLWFPLPR
ncbi:unnamed protein product [Meloidogyne enterolobii]|uniref:Uncharacterized protein n=1 Tax=Meloidogyne enterolobii TaxID=390850 RepID=A0ACB1AH12_MELEN